MNQAPIPCTDPKSTSSARSPRAAALMVALASSTGLAAVYVLAVHTQLGQLADTHAMVTVADDLAGAAWTESLLVLVSPVTAILAACSLAAIAGSLRGGRAAALVLATAGGTATGAVVLKVLLVRPQLLDDAANSLPSGHVAIVAGLAAGTVVVATPGVRPLVLATGIVVVGLTGVATIALQWHRPSDVLASVLLAIGVAAVARACETGRGAGTLRRALASTPASRRGTALS